jgi:hypothetical protein
MSTNSRFGVRNLVGSSQYAYCSGRVYVNLKILWNTFSQVEQKDRVIREQADYLDEYRMEILARRGDQQQEHQELQGQQSQQLQLQQHLRPHHRRKCFHLKHHQGCADNDGDQPSGGDATTETKVLDCARALSEEEDSWSEPGIPLIIVIA